MQLKASRSRVRSLASKSYRSTTVENKVLGRKGSMVALDCLVDERFQVSMKPVEVHVVEKAGGFMGIRD